ncbi:hypothetical protein [Ferrimonas marina]|uniref:Uncharacterized protein n=1 Tax=Ferrimonas marina TaxID=299255 RepID=A0A1M5TD42_9GAMM|nr:hypothetical protein [Ferrimonas marina]SHH48638.1 hypothetical protein SAMN02745129_2091 [Ferrimonas marina]
MTGSLRVHISLAIACSAMLCAVPHVETTSGNPKSSGDTATTAHDAQFLGTGRVEPVTVRVNKRRTTLTDPATIACLDPDEVVSIRAVQRCHLHVGDLGNYSASQYPLVSRNIARDEQTSYLVPGQGTVLLQEHFQYPTAHHQVDALIWLVWLWNWESLAATGVWMFERPSYYPEAALLHLTPEAHNLFGMELLESYFTALFQDFARLSRRNVALVLYDHQGNKVLQTHGRKHADNLESRGLKRERDELLAFGPRGHWGGVVPNNMDWLDAQAYDNLYFMDRPGYYPGPVSLGWFDPAWFEHRIDPVATRRVAKEDGASFVIARDFDAGSFTVSFELEGQGRVWVGPRRNHHLRHRSTGPQAKRFANVLCDERMFVEVDTDLQQATLTCGDQEVDTVKVGDSTGYVMAMQVGVELSAGSSVSTPKIKRNQNGEEVR